MSRGRLLLEVFMVYCKFLLTFKIFLDERELVKGKISTNLKFVPAFLQPVCWGQGASWGDYLTEIIILILKG